MRKTHIFSLDGFMQLTHSRPINKGRAAMIFLEMEPAYEARAQQHRFEARRARARHVLEWARLEVYEAIADRSRQNIPAASFLTSNPTRSFWNWSPKRGGFGSVKKMKNKAFVLSRFPNAAIRKIPGDGFHPSDAFMVVAGDKELRLNRLLNSPGAAWRAARFAIARMKG